MQKTPKKILDSVKAALKTGGSFYVQGEDGTVVVSGVTTEKSIADFTKAASGHTPGPEHLTTCYEDETGSLANPEVFWVCGRNCPVTNPPKTHSPAFTGTLCGAKSTRLDTAPTCKRCRARVHAAIAQAEGRS